MLRKDKDRLIRYNYPKIIATYKLLESNQTKRIQEVQAKDLDINQYKVREVTYVLREIAEEFIKDFYRGII